MFDVPVNARATQLHARPPAYSRVACSLVTATDCSSTLAPHEASKGHTRMSNETLAALKAHSPVYGTGFATLRSVSKTLKPIPRYLQKYPHPQVRCNLRK
mmetsp:Transcript_73561/g.177975  ORF Transcript_73561/g.177975 Transcript_73561/m.177975 type:complete len:100 (+) Transcript_73561:4-303(+)